MQVHVPSKSYIFHASKLHVRLCAAYLAQPTWTSASYSTVDQDQAPRIECYLYEDQKQARYDTPRHPHSRGMGDRHAEKSQLVGPHTARCLEMHECQTPVWGVAVGGTVGSLCVPVLSCIPSLAIDGN